MSFDSLIIGLDESNHGRFPEFFVSTFSYIPDDLQTKGRLPKRRHHKETFLNTVARDYSFLLASKNELEHIKEKSPEKMYGIVVASLMGGLDLKGHKRVDFLVDGPLNRRERKYLREIVGDLYHLQADNLWVKAGGHFDQKYLPVNLADELAHFFFSNYDADGETKNHKEFIENNPRRRSLMTSLI